MGAGFTVIRDVPDYALVVGNPARIVGWVCECGGAVGLHGFKRSHLPKMWDEVSERGAGCGVGGGVVLCFCVVRFIPLACLVRSFYEMFNTYSLHAALRHVFVLWQVSYKK